MKRLTIAASVAAVFAVAPAAHAGDGWAAAGLMPDDTSVLVNINLKRLRGSAVYSDILATARARDSYKEGVADFKQAGIDLEKDVDTLLLGVRAGANGSNDGVVLVAEGRFNPKRLLRVLRKKNGDMKVRRHKGVKYYELKTEGSIAILGRRVVLAENGRMPAVIDLYKGRGKSITSKRAFKKLTSKIDRRKDVWFAMEIPTSQRAGFGIPAAENIEAIAGSLDLRSGLGLRLRVTSTDNSSAKQLTAMVKMGLTMAESNPQAKQMGLDSVARKAVLITDERDTVFKVDLSKAEAARLKGVVEMAGGSM